MRVAIILVLILSFMGCKNWRKKEKPYEVIYIESEKEKEEPLDHYEKGTYGYDVKFLREYPNNVELKNGDSKIIISMKYQSRVMTSTSNGYGGRSYGWINYDLISSGEILPQFNPVGGEERFWVGPEGGQFGLFFKPGSSFDFENWQVPSCIDTDSFRSFVSTDSIAVFIRDMEVENYNNFNFRFNMTRKIDLMGAGRISDRLGIHIPEDVKYVGYETTNYVKNTSEEDWTKEKGLLSIWLLGMFKPSPGVTMVLPYNTNVTSGYIVKDDYFGKIPKDRLKIEDGIIYFKGDGKHRGKIGIPPRRAKEIIGSYDSENKVLTLLKVELPKGAVDYVNSAWEHQRFPYRGDAINAYNDGPLEDGGQLGPFYELESSSPALALQRDSTKTYTQSTYHFEGEEAVLDTICRQVFNIPLEKIKSAFN